jgi:ribosomal protein S18 acetylase RimI-like enzyme
LNAAQYSVRETLDDGSPVTIRAARPDIGAALDDRQPTEIDYVGAVVLLATIGAPQQETVIGLGRYVASSRSAEVAFVVAKDYADRGIAGRLLHHLTHIARENGMAKFEADVRANNEPMLAVFRDSGLPMTTTTADGITHVTLLL